MNETTNSTNQSLEEIAEQAIFAFNQASKTLFGMMRTKQFDYQKADKTVKSAKRKREVFRRGYFGRKTKFSWLERQKAGVLIPEINIAMETFNRVLADWNLINTQPQGENKNV